LLGKDDSYFDFYKKRFSKILIPLIFWTLFYSSYVLIVRHNSTKVWDFESIIINILNGRPYFHLWYLYMLIGLYLITPLINRIIHKKIFKVCNIEIFGYLCLLLGFLVGLYFQLYGSVKISVILFIQYIGYYILGYTIGKRGNEWVKLKGLYMSLYVISCILIALLTYYTIGNGLGLYFYNYLSPLVIIGSICFYSYFSASNFHKNIFSKFAELTFGIYLVHAFVLTGLNKAFSILRINLSVFFDIPLKLTVVFIISLLLCRLISSFRLTKRII